MCEHEHVHLIVPGEPVPWQRARTRSGRHFKARQVVEYEQRIQTAWTIEGRPQFGKDPLVVSARFYFSRPPTHVTKGGRLRSGAPLHPPKRDLDNLLKQLDSLNGLLFHDDSQIVCFEHVRKLYAEPDEEARTEIDVWLAL